MTDYRPLLSRAIAGLDPNTGEARRAIYDRARTALVNQLRGIDPPLSEADITRERLALEDAIRKVEAEATAARHAPASPAAPPSQAPRAPRPDAVPAASQLQPGPEPADEPPYEDDPSAAEPPLRDPRMPRAGDPRGPRAPGRPDPALRPRAPRGRTPADFARAEARRASRTKLVVFGIVLLLLMLAGAVGYIHRDRILAIVQGLGEPQTAQQADTPPAAQNKADDRLPQQQTQQNPANPAAQPAGDTRRAFLFEENPGSQQFTTIAGTVSWRTETVNPGPGKAPELGVRIDVDIPERKMQVAITIRRNPDSSLPATHYIEIQFSGNDNFGGVAQVPVMRMKNNEAAQGIPLAGISIRVMQGFFLIGLSAAETDRDRNMQVMKTLNWLDIPFIYNNGRRAVVTFEKGAAGEKVLAEAFAAWGN